MLQSIQYKDQDQALDEMPFPVRPGKPQYLSHDTPITMNQPSLNLATVDKYTKHGYDNPVSLYRDSKGNLGVIDGTHRVAADKRAGRPTLATIHE
jgi:hypothetical protein